jgi:hypothetical protein
MVAELPEDEKERLRYYIQNGFTKKSLKDKSLVIRLIAFVNLNIGKLHLDIDDFYLGGYYYEGIDDDKFKKFIDKFISKLNLLVLDE